MGGQYRRQGAAAAVLVARATRLVLQDKAASRQIQVPLARLVSVCVIVLAVEVLDQSTAIVAATLSGAEARAAVFSPINRAKAEGVQFLVQEAAEVVVGLIHQILHTAGPLAAQPIPIPQAAVARAEQQT